MEFSDYSVTAGSVDGTSTIITSSGGPFVVGESGIYSGVIYAKKSADGMDLEGPGVTTDSSRDKWFWVARRKAGDQEAGGGGAGRQEIVSGTGRGDMRERPGPVNTRWITWPITDLFPKSVASGKETSKTL